MNSNKPTVEQVHATGKDVFGDELKYQYWLTCSIRALGYTQPRRLLHTRRGRKQLLAILGRIEHGVYS